MKRYLFLGLMILSMIQVSCGGEYKLSSDPIRINHKVSVDIEELTRFYNGFCAADPLNDTQAKIDRCTSNRVNEFLMAINL